MASALQIATLTRNLLTERSPGEVNVTIPHIQALIPVALEPWARQAMMDPEKHSALESEYTVGALSGVVDLTNYFNGTTAKISPSDLRGSTVYMEGITNGPAATWVGSYNQLLHGRSPSHVPAIFLDHNTLRIRNTDGSLTSYNGEDVRFAVAAIPLNAAAIPAELVGDFVMFLADLAVKEKFVDGR